MATKLQMFSELAEQQAQQLTKSRQKWTDFLDTAARLYKYPFDEQLMIYAQRPDAVACAQMDLWNNRFFRWVKPGSKGIALIDDSGERPALKYVFDIVDTEPVRNNARRPFIWEMREEHETAVANKLESIYEGSDNDLRVFIDNIANQLADEYYEDNAREIAYSIEDSFLSDYDEQNLGIAFKDALTVSVAYSIMSRCGLDTDDYFYDEDFQPIFDFNTPSAIYALGIATSDLSEQVCRDIEITIKNYERQKTTERSAEHEQSDLQPVRGVPAAQPDIELAAAGTGRAAGELRDVAQKLPEKSQDNSIHFPPAVGETVPAVTEDTDGSRRTHGTDDKNAGGTEPTAEQSNKPDGMGAAHEQPAPASGGSNTERNDLQLDEETEEPPEQENKPVAGGFSMPVQITGQPVQENKALLQNIPQISETLANSSISVSEVDTVLQDGGNQDYSTLRIAAYFMKNKPVADNANYLKNEYLQRSSCSGKGFQFGNDKLAVWFDEAGITLGRGDTAIFAADSVLITWEQAAVRVRELLDNGCYISGDMLDEAIDNEHKHLAERYWDLYRDFFEIPEEWRAEGGGYPADTEKIKSLIDNPETFAEMKPQIIKDMSFLVETWQVRRAHYHTPKQVLQDTLDCNIAPLPFPRTDFSQDSYMRFITEDEIDSFFIMDNKELKLRMLSFFLESKTAKEQSDFIKDRYKNAGSCPALGAADKSYYSGFYGGLNFQRGLVEPEAEYKLSWNAAAKRIMGYIKEGRYASREELDSIHDYEIEQLAHSIAHFYYCLPEEYERPYPDGTDYWKQYKYILPIIEEQKLFDELLEFMKPIVDNTHPDDRYYDSRLKTWERVNEYKDGTYTLFPGLDLLPAPETVSDKTKAAEHAPQQLSLFSTAPKEDTLPPSTPELPGALEQREIIEQVIQSEEKKSVQEKTETISQTEIDLLLQSAVESTEQYEKIINQFSTKPRSREAMQLLKDTYRMDAYKMERIDDIEGILGISGTSMNVYFFKNEKEDTVDNKNTENFVVLLPWAKVLKRVTELVENGDFKYLHTQPEHTVQKNESSETPLIDKSISAESLLDEFFHTPSTDISHSSQALAGWTLNNLANTRVDPIALFDNIKKPYSEEKSAEIRQLMQTAILNDTADVADDEKVPVPFPVKTTAWQNADVSDKHIAPDGTRSLLLMRGNFASFVPIVIDDENGHDILQVDYWNAENHALKGSQKVYAIEELKFLVPFENFEILKVTPAINNVSLPTKEKSFTVEDEEIVPKYTVGDTVTLEDNREFVIESIDGDKISLQDKTFQANTGYPILRVEYADNFERLLREYGKTDFVEAAEHEKEEGALQDATFHEDIEQMAFGEMPVPASENIVKAEPPVVVPPAVNFHIENENIGVGSPKTRFANNVEAIKVLKEIEENNRQATPQEQEILSQYVGWGGLSQAFDDTNDGWRAEYGQLKSLLETDEYEKARASALDAFYTPPVVAGAIYNALDKMGFTKGNILEPSCGTGNFFGTIPEKMQSSKLYGIELDSLSARIASQLYPNANIQNTGFEKANFPDSFFDVAVGNIPFGDYKVFDRAYSKHNFLIHDYFIAKAIDKVRAGGVVALVTSGGTMDKKDSKARRYIAEHCVLAGAIRLPDNTFKSAAGTEVTTDILFLQKREVPRVWGTDIPDWVDVQSFHKHEYEDENGVTQNNVVTINKYFAEHPEMILGTLQIESGPYGPRLACKDNGINLKEQLNKAISNIEAQITYSEPELDDLADIENVGSSIPANPDVKNFSYAVQDNKVYYRENSQMYPVDMPATTLDRVRGMVKLRDCVHTLIEYQLQDYEDFVIKGQQQKLDVLYERFTKKYGLINSTANGRAFSRDSAYYLLCSLEILDENGKLESKADMFTKRTIKQKMPVSSVDTASEALAVSIGERACVDMGFMSELTGIDKEGLALDLTGVIFRVPEPLNDEGEPNYVTADEYLSGNVREKLETAKMAAEISDMFLPNVEALEKAMPKDLEASEISVRLGSTWIDKSYIQQFMYELLQSPENIRRVCKVNYSKFTDVWQISEKSRVPYDNIAAHVTYGTRRKNAYEIIEDTLNLRDTRVYDYIVEDGKEKRVLNKKETTLVQQKQETIKQEFKNWIWKDPERRQTLVRLYNDKFNCIRPREYDGSHLVFSGISPEITLLDHQLDAIAHILYGGNTLLAHEVGAGKTFEMIGAAMEGKRLGLCNKSMFAVPNHLTEQTATEFLRLYPSANILVATKKDFEKRNRKKFCARIATGNYDAVIIGHSQLEKIPISKNRQERLLQEQICEVIDGIDEIKRSNGEQFTVKQLERTRKRLEERLEKLQEGKGRDDVVTFEQLGVDRLYVDEAHNFKNLFLYTKMRNVAGLSQTEAQKSSDLFLKCRYMDELTNNKGVIFATGTPISNSMTEMYTMQRYLQYDDLEYSGLTHFDSWASTFGETVTAIELAPEGTGYRARTRFAKFHNLPELMAQFKEVADIKTADTLNLKRPKANYETIVVQPSELQKEMVQSLSERAAEIHSGNVDPSKDNMLKITSDGRKIGLDQRLINPMLPDFESSKVNACMNNIHKIWEDTGNKRLAQLVFCDFSTPNKDGRFNVYDDIREKLIAKGVPENEIAFIHDANTELQKKELFAKVRSGRVRILFGSTAKLGAGTNVQDRLIAMHDLDCPWRPADLEQRAGRIVRQYNQNPEVFIYRYVTEGTFDAYLWQTVENKQKFISQIMTSKSPVRTCEDVDETSLSYAEIKALCAGNPLIREKIDLDIDVARLRLLKGEYQNQQYRLEDNILKHFPESIKATEERIHGLTEDIANVQAYMSKTVGQKSTEDKAHFSPMTIMGTQYPEKEQAGKALLESCKKVKDREPVNVGSYMGFDMSIAFNSFEKSYKLTLKNKLSYTIALGSDTFGNITRINNALKNDLPQRLETSKQQLDNYKQQFEDAKVEIKKPFEQEQELAEKEMRLALVNAELNIDDGVQPLEAAATVNEAQQAVSAKAKPSILAKLRTPQADTTAFQQPKKQDRDIVI